MGAMAGTMRKMAVYLGLVEDQDRYGEYGEYGEYEDADYDETAGTDRRPERPVAAVRDTAVVAPVAAPRSVDRIGAPRELDRITTLHPRTYNEARTIGEHFREGTPVIMNLSEMDDADAKRLVDFAAGLIFGLRGSIERVTQKVFLLSPQNVTVTAEDKARIAEGGFFNQS
jgi:cell division inhibitor SepF